MATATMGNCTAHEANMVLIPLVRRKGLWGHTSNLIVDFPECRQFVQPGRHEPLERQTVGNNEDLRLTNGAVILRGDHIGDYLELAACGTRQLSKNVARPGEEGCVDIAASVRR